MKFRTEFGKLNSFVLDSLRGLDETIQYQQGAKRADEMQERSDGLAGMQKKLSEMEGSQRSVTNLVILIALYRLGFRYAFAINCVRIVIAGLLFSGVFGMLYSFGGGMLSILIMYLLYRTKLFSMVGISMAGGVMHNLGQLLTACAIMSNLSLMSYFAVLFFSGLISGILIGILAYSIEKRLPADFR